MPKALVAIGVGKTNGSFPKLKGAVQDARAFHAWGEAQGFVCKLFVDEGRKKVRVADIFEAIDEFARSGVYSQIVVYFSGHGILKAPDCELWLMSGAPNNPNEAINVHGSITNARGSGIEHVVFVSDACRSLPSDLREASMHGQDLFAIIRYADPLPEVDVFYATLPGNVALEVAPDASSQRDRGLLTQCLLNALEGNVPEVIHPLDLDGVASQVVPCRPLKAWLTAAVPLAAEAISLRLQQMPDSRIESGASKYLSRLADLAAPAKLRTTTVTQAYGPSTGAAYAPVDGLGPRRLVPSRMGARTPEQRATPRQTASWPGRPFADSIARERSIATIVNASASQRMTTGLLVKGAVLRSVVRSDGIAELASDGRDSWVDFDAGAVARDPLVRAEAVAIRFADGTGTVLAVIDGYIATVVMAEGRVATVNYTPGSGSRNHAEYVLFAAELETRRAAVAVDAGNGTFSVNSTGASGLADYIRFLKRVDPTLGIYACYAYARAGQFHEVVDIHRIMKSEPEPAPFDVVMLATQFTDSEFPAAPPGMPMLTQGWMSMGRFEQLLPEALARARQFMLPSLWASFSPEGMAVLECYITRR